MLGTSLAGAQAPGNNPGEEQGARRQQGGRSDAARGAEQGSRREGGGQSRAGAVARANSGGRGGQRSDREAANVALPPEVAALQPLSLVLGRPTDRAITVNVLAGDSLEGWLEYGAAAGQYDQQHRDRQLSRRHAGRGDARWTEARHGVCVPAELAQSGPGRFRRRRATPLPHPAGARAARSPSRSRATRTPNARSSTILHSTPRRCPPPPRTAPIST